MVYSQNSNNKNKNNIYAETTAGFISEIVLSLIFNCLKLKLNFHFLICCCVYFFVVIIFKSKWIFINKKKSESRTNDAEAKARPFCINDAEAKSWRFRTIDAEAKAWPFRTNDAEANAWPFSTKNAEPKDRLFCTNDAEAKSEPTNFKKGRSLSGWVGNKVHMKVSRWYQL